MSLPRSVSDSVVLEQNGTNNKQIQNATGDATSSVIIDLSLCHIRNYLQERVAEDVCIEYESLTGVDEDDLLDHFPDENCTALRVTELFVEDSDAILSSIYNNPLLERVWIQADSSFAIRFESTEKAV